MNQDVDKLITSIAITIQQGVILVTGDSLSSTVKSLSEQTPITTKILFNIQSDVIKAETLSISELDIRVAFHQQPSFGFMQDISQNKFNLIVLSDINLKNADLLETNSTFQELILLAQSMLFLSGYIIVVSEQKTLDIIDESKWWLARCEFEDNNTKQTYYVYIITEKVMVKQKRSGRRRKLHQNNS